jgi:2-dehydro-3-deoxygluconokinase
LQGCDVQAMAECGLALAALKHSLPGDMCLIGPGELAGFSTVRGDVRR